MLLLFDFLKWNLIIKMHIHHTTYGLIFLIDWQREHTMLKHELQIFTGSMSVTLHFDMKKS